MPEDEYREIKTICEKYGYGNVMALASALWEIQLEKCNLPIVIAFIPTIRTFIKKKYSDVGEPMRELYRKICEKYN